MMRAKDVMTPRVLTVSENAAVLDAAQLMVKRRISGLRRDGGGRDCRRQKGNHRSRERNHSDHGRFLAEFNGHGDFLYLMSFAD